MAHLTEQRRPRPAGAVVAAAFALLIIGIAMPARAQERPLRTGDVVVPAGFRVEVAVKGLAAPTMVAFDDEDRMLIAESGYCPDPDRCPNGPGAPKVTRVERDGSRTVLAEGADFGDETPVTSVAFHDGRVYVVHAGTISVIEGERLRRIVSGLPGQGDHQANQLVFHDGFMYVSVGTVTNSGVVGPDNAVFGWLKKPKLAGLRDVPCEDVTLVGQRFVSPNPFDVDPGVFRQLGGKTTVETGAYSPFGRTRRPGEVVKGDVRCNGAVLRARPDGSGLEVHAWGFRNPYGLELGPDGALYATDHGFDARGSRPIENAWDCLWKVERGRWYGSPDHSCGEPVTDPRFKPRDKPQPGFILRSHPPGPRPTPIARFDPHAATNGFAFAPSRTWGAPTTAFVALFGDMTPGTGVVDRPKGYKVVKVDTRTGSISDFVTNRVPGRPSQHGAGGIEHPSDVTFGPDGAMYVTDWGVARVSVDGIRLEPGSGVVWRITPGLGSGGAPASSSRLIALPVFLALAVLSIVLARGDVRPVAAAQGAVAGLAGGVVLAAFASFVAAPLLRLPWFAPARLMASVVMGGDAIQNILEFDPATFLLGALVVLALGALLGMIFAFVLRTASATRAVFAAIAYAVAAWVALQFFVFPIAFPLIVDKGFPPAWYAATFVAYGVALAVAVLVLVRRAEQGPAAASPHTG